MRDQKNQAMSAVEPEAGAAGLGTVFAQSPVAMVVVDANGVVIEANAAAGRLSGTEGAPIIGVRPGQVIGCRCALMTPAGCGFGAECRYCPLRDVVGTTLTTGRGVERVRKKFSFQAGIGQGLVERILAVSTALLSRQGDPPRLLIVLEDITERDAAETALAESELRFRQLAENVHEVFWLYDITTHGLLYVSPAYETIWGQSCEFLLRNPLSWQDSILPEDRESVAVAFSQIVEHGFNVEYRIRRPDGEIRWISDRAFAVRDPSGAPQRIAGIAEDITRYRLAQDLAVRQQAELVHLARLNTVGQLSSGLAHELNQPLGAIANYAGACQHLLGRPRLPRKALALAVENILIESRRAADVISHLRAMVRKQAPMRVQAQVRALVDEAIRLSGPQLSHADIHVATSIPDNLPAIEVDTVQIVQVLLNLIQNAVDAPSEAGLAAREITVAGHCPDGGSIVLSVSDNGPGFSPEQLARLFEPFHTSKPGGLGVGLNICRTIVENHGGHIRAANRPGGGAIVDLSIPISRCG